MRSKQGLSENNKTDSTPSEKEDSKNKKTGSPLDEKKELLPDEVRELKEAATQTRFTWVVLLLTFVTILEGLLSLARPYPVFDLAEFTFITMLTFAYCVLTVAACYSFYALCRTTYIIDVLTRCKWSKTVQDFLTENWSVGYLNFIVKDNKFNKSNVIGLSVFIGVISVLLLFSKLYIPT